MAILHNLGFSRIGANRELKFQLEKFWHKEITEEELETSALTLRETHWKNQRELDYVPVGDFSFYDQVLDTSFLLGNIPERVKGLEGNTLDNYFRVARGRSANDNNCSCVNAGEMTKWFDTNYHYIVPEFSSGTSFQLNSERLINQIKEAQALGYKVKPVILGPVSYLWLGKETDQSQKINLLEQLLPVYHALLQEIAALNVEWVQIDEPILVTELEPQWQQAISKAYQVLSESHCKILLATYFGELKENLSLVCNLPVSGVHLDTINSKNEVLKLVGNLKADQIVSLGVVNGRNIWKTDINALLSWLEPISKQLQNRLWIAPSCSLLHVPVDLTNEVTLNAEIKNWLAFALQKLEELSLIHQVLNNGRDGYQDELTLNAEAIQSRELSGRVNTPAIKDKVNSITPDLSLRKSSYIERSAIQKSVLNLPLYPTTTIGSFPQTADIRKTRQQFKKGEITQQQYTQLMKNEIAKCVEIQHELALDVLVHGEPERNDMVEYFGEQLSGYAFSESGWVQSYGSRCVKPPIIFGDVSRPKAITVEWTKYAQSLTNKPLKGMLTGPVTILNWSFVRDDQPRATTCLQLALAIREEVLDLEAAGINIIQIDEAALREGLPLRKSQWAEYLDWAVQSFKITANGVSDKTQIHTHMCYSEFNDIIEAIANMDADVITIETSRSNMELLDVFDEYKYPNELGPGVYDIHTPNIQSEDYMVELIEKAQQRIPAERLWVNPDCGLKTRKWAEVKPALKNMVNAAKILRTKAIKEGRDKQVENKDLAIA